MTFFWGGIIVTIAVNQMSATPIATQLLAKLVLTRC